MKEDKVEPLEDLVILRLTKVHSLACSKGGDVQVVLQLEEDEALALYLQLQKVFEGGTE